MLLHAVHVVELALSVLRSRRTCRGPAAEQEAGCLQQGDGLMKSASESSLAVLFLQRVLILGWGDTVLMTDLLAELDHGPAALPRGSEVYLFNTWSSQEVMGKPA